jgi:hypothetical protein
MLGYSRQGRNLFSGGGFNLDLGVRNCRNQMDGRQRYLRLVKGFLRGGGIVRGNSLRFPNHLQKTKNDRIICWTNIPAVKHHDATKISFKFHLIFTLIRVIYPPSSHPNRMVIINAFCPQKPKPIFTVILICRS